MFNSHSTTRSNTTRSSSLHAGRRIITLGVVLAMLFSWASFVSPDRAEAAPLYDIAISWDVDEVHVAAGARVDIPLHMTNTGADPIDLGDAFGEYVSISDSALAGGSWAPLGPADGLAIEVGPGLLELILAPSGGPVLFPGETITGMWGGTAQPGVLPIDAANLSGDDNVSNDISTVVVFAGPPPVAVDDDYRSGPTLALTDTTFTVMANDTANGATITDVTDGAFGHVTTDGSTVTYTSTEGIDHYGHDTFTYTLTNPFGSDTATVDVRVAGIDMEMRSGSGFVNQSAGPLNGTSEAVAGDTVRLRFNVWNTTSRWSTRAKQLTGNIAVDPGLTYVSSSCTHTCDSGWTFDPVTGDFDLGATKLAEGERALIEIMYTVDSGTAGNRVDAVGTVDPDGSGAPDFYTANNTITRSLDILAADIAVTSTADRSAIELGETVNFYVDVSSDVDAWDVQIHNMPPPGFAYMGSAVTAGTYDSASNTWDIPFIAAGTHETLTVTMMAGDPASAGMDWNSVAALSASSPEDNTPANDSDSATVHVNSADLRTRSNWTDNTPGPGQVLTQRIRLWNDGPDAASNVVYYIDVPTGNTTFQSIPRVDIGSAVYNAGQSRVEWTIPVLPGNSDVQELRIRTQIDPYPIAQPGDPIVFQTMQVAGSTYDPDMSNNDSEATEFLEGTDIEVDVTGPGTADVGETFDYVVTVTNSGPYATTGVRTRDILPNGVSLDGVTASSGTWGNGVHGDRWDIGALAPGQTETLTLTVTVVDDLVASTVLANRALINWTGNQVDLDPTNNDASVYTYVPLADLQVTVGTDTSTPRIGEPVTVSVTAMSLGIDPSEDVEVDVSVPSGMVLDSATATAGTYAGGIWTLGTAGVLSPAVLTLIMHADDTAAGVHYDVGATGMGRTFDPALANNVDVSSGVVQDADLSITMQTPGSGRYYEGESIGTELFVSNAGPDMSGELQATFALPSNVTFIRWEGLAPGASYNPVTGAFDLDGMRLNAGDTNVSIGTIFYEADEGTAGEPIIVSASVDQDAQGDSDPSNNSVMDSFVVRSSDVEVTVLGTEGGMNVGEPWGVIYQIMNNGPDPVRFDLTTSSVVPGTFEFLTGDILTGYFDSVVPIDPQHGSWLFRWDALQPGVPVQIELVFMPTPAAAGTFAEFQAQAAHAVPRDIDGSNDLAVAGLYVPTADLRSVVRVSDTTPGPDQTFRYKVRVVNDGPDTAEDVTAVVGMAGLDFVNVVRIDAGTFDEATGVWDLGNMAAGASAWLYVKVEPSVSSPLAGDVPMTLSSLVASITYDGDHSNNAGTRDIVVQESDLEAAVAVSGDPTQVGEEVTFTLTVTNNGVSDATGVKARAMVGNLEAAGFTVTSIVTDDGTTGNGATGERWDIGDLEAGGTATLLVTGTPQASAAGTTLELRLKNARSQQSDPVQGNDTATGTVYVPIADLDMTIAMDPGPYDVGDAVTVTVTLDNLGVDDTTNIAVPIDVSGLGAEITHWAASAGTYNNGSWDISTVGAGTQATLTLNGTFTGSVLGDVGVSASAAGDEYDPTPVANVGATAYVQSADLSVEFKVDNAAPFEGDEVELVILVSNHGPDTAVGATAVVHLVGLTPIDGSGSTPPLTEGIVDLGDIPAGTTVVRVASFTVDDGTKLTDLIQTVVVSSGTYDPVWLNGSDTVTISVAYAPPELEAGEGVDVGASRVTFGIDEDSPFEFDPIGLFRPSDQPGLIMTAFDAVSAEGGTVETGSLIYTPPADFAGTDEFTYTVTDGTADVLVTVVMDVAEVNDAPILVDGDGVAMPDAFTVSVSVDGTPGALNPHDPDGSVATVSVSGGTLPTGLTLDPDGTYVGAATVAGTYVADVTVTDGVLSTTYSITYEVAELPFTGINTDVLLLLATLLLLGGMAAVLSTRKRRDTDA